MGKTSERGDPKHFSGEHAGCDELKGILEGEECLGRGSVLYIPVDGKE